MLINEAVQGSSRRSSSAWAKNALASFRMSSDRRNSFTSRSRALMRSRLRWSAVTYPSVDPVFAHPFTQGLRSAADLRGNRLYGSPNVKDIHAVLLHHAHCAFADFRGDLFDLFMAPSSQRLEPPQNPGRFNFVPGGRLKMFATWLKPKHVVEELDFSLIPEKPILVRTCGSCLLEVSRGTSQAVQVVQEPFDFREFLCAALRAQSAIALERC